MEITFTNAPDQSLILNYPLEFAGDSQLSERLTEKKTSWGRLRIKECWFKGACLLQSNFLVTAQSSIHLKCNHYCWLMNFTITGGISSQNGGQQYTMEQGSCQTFYCGALNIQLQIDQPTETYTICLTRRFIRKLLGEEPFAESLYDIHQPLKLIISDAYQHNRLGILLQEIIQARQAPHIRRIFLEAKILELLSFQLEKHEKYQGAKQILSNEDVERLNEACRLVGQQLQVPFSLKELARKTGLNDFKLKRGFKMLFGQTVFGYLTDLRMKKASELLYNGYRVSEVAEQVGYKNAHHFTVAFKKKFDTTPSKIKGTK